MKTRFEIGVVLSVVATAVVLNQACAEEWLPQQSDKQSVVVPQYSQSEFGCADTPSDGPFGSFFRSPV